MKKLQVGRKDSNTTDTTEKLFQSQICFHAHPTDINYGINYDCLFERKDHRCLGGYSSRPGASVKTQDRRHGSDWTFYSTFFSSTDIH